VTSFRYQGFDGAGVKTKGELAANSREEVERRLAQQNITPTSILVAKGIKTPAATAKTKKQKGRVSDADRATILRDLATMVDAGVPFVEALEAVVAAKPKASVEVPLAAIRSNIVGGSSISSAIRSAELFPPLVADVIGVAERGGRLDNALDNAAGYLERSADLRRKVMNASMYPLVMLGVSSIMMVVIIVFVLPRFGELFTKMKADLPVTTKAMLAVGKFVQVQPLTSAGVALAVVATLFLLLRQAAVKRLIGTLALRVPGLGDLLVRLGLARALRVVSTLLGSNVSIITALESGAKVSGIPAISRALEDAIESVRMGGSLSDALRRSKYVPSAVTQMVIVGERTGRLGALLESCAAKMEAESDARLKSLVSIIEPIMILLMGVVVGGITISIITPIYSSMGNIK
jgi:type IV pilus assembly protein PilC